MDNLENDPSEAIENIEDISIKHRQERKDLQAKITALKKSVPKNDKKKKKEVAELIFNLENELEKKHLQEISTLGTDNTAEPDICEPIQISNEYEIDATSEQDPDQDCGDVKLTRAQRRRNKKEHENKERNKRIQNQEQLNKKGPRTAELSAIKEALKQLGLQIHNVPADGNCLYCSIKHQLEVSSRAVHDVQDLRKLTADFIRENKDEFLPFMCNDDDGLIDEEHFEKYCHDVATTKLWGGQLELRALSNILKCPIKVIQANGPPTIQGEQFDGEPLVITYHRHLYRLGEHFNSTSCAQLVETS